jgi:hypothetical protein
VRHRSDRHFEIADEPWGAHSSLAGSETYQPSAVAYAESETRGAVLNGLPFGTAVAPSGSAVDRKWKPIVVGACLSVPLVVGVAALGGERSSHSSKPRALAAAEPHRVPRKAERRTRREEAPRRQTKRVLQSFPKSLGPHRRISRAESGVPAAASKPPAARPPREGPALNRRVIGVSDAANDAGNEFSFER